MWAGMWALVAAVAAPGDERAELQLGGAEYWVEGGTWSEGPAAVTLERGFGFSVDHDGQPVGVVFVGRASHTLSGLAPGALIGDGGLPLDALDGSTWTTAVDVAWTLGADHLPGRTDGWTHIAQEGPVIYDLDAVEQPTILVVDPRDLASARRTAAATLAQRTDALVDDGFPLGTAVAALATAGPWSLMEARTAFDLSSLAGNAVREDRWVTTLTDDLLAGAGGTTSTMAFGARLIAAVTGC
jgi:hypothetical protein